MLSVYGVILAKGKFRVKGAFWKVVVAEVKVGKLIFNLQQNLFKSQTLSIKFLELEWNLRVLCECECECECEWCQWMGICRWMHVYEFVRIYILKRNFEDDLKRNGIIFLFWGIFFSMSWLFLLMQYFDVFIDVHILVFTVHNV